MPHYCSDCLDELDRLEAHDETRSPRLALYALRNYLLPYLPLLSHYLTLLRRFLRDCYLLLLPDPHIRVPASFVQTGRNERGY